MSRAPRDVKFRDDNLAKNLTRGRVDCARGQRKVGAVEMHHVLGAFSGGGATILREGFAPTPASDWVATLDDIEEIRGWLGTFGARLRIARRAGMDSSELSEITIRLGARLQQRRAELS